MNDAQLPDGGRLAYEIRGEGPSLLLLRPLGGSILSWGRFADELAEHVRVIMFDSRGTGASSPASWRMTTRSMARDARSVLDQIGVERAHVYGISLGGMVASWLAIDAPNRVGQLVLASTLPRGSMLRLASWQRDLAIARCLTKTPAEAEACMAEQILSPQFRAAHPDEVRRIRDAARASPASRRARLTLLLAAVTHDVEARLHEIKARVLVLIGEHDPLLTIDSQKHLLERLAHASYDVVPGAGHDLSAEAPHATAQRVLATLASSPSPDFFLSLMPVTRARRAECPSVTRFRHGTTPHELAIRRRKPMAGKLLHVAYCPAALKGRRSTIGPA